ncbi:HAMP domain-containing sensor histidine kinase [Janibacter sp. DB-40]|uniref:sensor histidine kinase n=1 Tax=Janibacter sp. DB-40 TaxID=3028808 RepID=UPI002407705E|nr:HAMP domain-containing sensor histidine kinase [Janibacter sp. DB-40]
MSYGALVRRLLLAVALGGAAVTALVLGLVLVVVADGQSVLGLDPEAWVVIAPAVGAGLVALAALAVLRVIDGRRARGLTFITAQVETIREGGGALPRTNVGLTDIDATTQAIARLAGELARQRALDRDFAADASHQLRTPLTALLMRLEEIAETDDLDVIRDEAAVAVTQVERLSGVVDTLRSRTQEGEEIPEISLDSVLAGLQREYQPAFTAAHRTMRVDGPPGLAVRCAPMDLAQILQSLIENSLAHGDGRVTITMRGSIGSVVLEVQDEGEGVPTAIAPHIFERSVTSSGSGLGLGLARQLAERNGGRLELVQAQPAVFTVFLSGPGRR